MEKHTSGAIGAAEMIVAVICAHKDKRYFTEYEREMVRGIADIIDRETEAPAMVEALRDALNDIQTARRLAYERGVEDIEATLGTTARDLQEILARIEG